MFVRMEETAEKDASLGDDLNILEKLEAEEREKVSLIAR